MAIPGGGNQQISNNLIYLLESKKHLEPKNTLIGINITGLDRFDLMCPIDHPDANKYFSWQQDFGYGWITEGSFCNSAPPFNGKLQKNIGIEQLILYNCLAIIQCFSYIELQGFRYFFMLMDNNILKDSPEWFKNFVLNNSHFVKFDQVNNMHDFAQQQKELSTDGFHPSKNGYKMIAQQVKDFLNKDPIFSKLL